MSRFVGIDPSTNTGLVIINHGVVTHQKVIKGVGDQDPKRTSTLIDDLSDHIKPGDYIAIESPAWGAKGRGISVQFGIAYLIRDMLYRRRLKYTDINPAHVKTWVGKGKKKEDVKKNVEWMYAFTHKSNDIIDAFVIAKIAEALQGGQVLTAKQEEIIQKITGVWVDEPKPRATRGKKSNIEQSVLFE